MKEKIGNMWLLTADAYCITTNGIIKGNGRAVMGAGVALSAVKRFPQCDKHLGDFIKLNGHVAGVFYSFDGGDLISFPTKNHWKDPSDIKLIEKSSNELMHLLDKKMYNSVVLPRPGCFNGGLNWEDVKVVVEKILDDRVIVVSL